MEIQNRKVTVLDGDIIRKILSTELGFSKEHRSLNVRRIGFVAKEITKHLGIAIVPLIAPYQLDRGYVRKFVENVGGYIEIYIYPPPTH